MLSGTLCSNAPEARKVKLSAASATFEQAALFQSLWLRANYPCS